MDTAVDIAPADCGKDTMLWNTLRHLAPGIVKPATAEYLSGQDQTKVGKAQARSTCTYTLVEANPDFDLSKLSMSLVRTTYGNHSEQAMRDSGKESVGATSNFPVLILMSNYGTYPKEGFPAEVMPKIAPCLGHIFDELYPHGLGLAILVVRRPLLRLAHARALLSVVAHVRHRPRLVGLRLGLRRLPTRVPCIA